MTLELQKDIPLLVDPVKGTGLMEVLAGPTGRRKWPDDVKARIVAESFQKGVRVCDVARRNGLAAQHLSTWRRLARDGKLALNIPDEASFATLVLDDEPPLSRTNAPAMSSMPQIEIIASGVTVRLPGDSPARQIADIATALRKTP
jgi:transposase